VVDNKKILKKAEGIKKKAPMQRSSSSQDHGKEPLAQIPV